MSNPNCCTQEEFIFELDEMLEKVGINLEVAHLECYPGQIEFTFQPEYGIQACDNTFIFKQAVSIYQY